MDPEEMDDNLTTDADSTDDSGDTSTDSSASLDATAVSTDNGGISLASLGISLNNVPAIAGLGGILTPITQRMGLVATTKPAANATPVRWARLRSWAAKMQVSFAAFCWGLGLVAVVALWVLYKALKKRG